MNIKNIAELIILQCIEDLWNEREMSGSADFFIGEGFPLCAGLAGMDLRDQGRLLNMVGKTMTRNFAALKRPEPDPRFLQLQ